MLSKTGQEFLKAEYPSFSKAGTAEYLQWVDPGRKETFVQLVLDMLYDALLVRRLFP